MFRKPKIFLVLPLSIEFEVDSSIDGYVFTWAEDLSAKWRVNADEELIKQLIRISKDYARYQNEPFSLGSAHHRWLWFYQDHIPSQLQTAAVKVRPSSSLQMEHYGKTVMEAFVSKQLKTKESEFTSLEHISLSVLTWNTSGNSPKGELSEWLLSLSKKHTVPIVPDLLIIGLQEMCELTKLLGDQLREQEWVDYLRQETGKAFGSKYSIVNFYIGRAEFFGWTHEFNFSF